MGTDHIPNLLIIDSLVLLRREGGRGGGEEEEGGGEGEGEEGEGKFTSLLSAPHRFSPLATGREAAARFRRRAPFLRCRPGSPGTAAVARAGLVRRPSPHTHTHTHTLPLADRRTANGEDRRANFPPKELGSRDQKV